MTAPYQIVLVLWAPGERERRHRSTRRRRRRHSLPPPFSDRNEMERRDIYLIS